MADSILKMAREENVNSIESSKACFFPKDQMWNDFLEEYATETKNILIKNGYCPYCFTKTKNEIISSDIHTELYDRPVENFYGIFCKKHGELN